MATKRFLLIALLAWTCMLCLPAAGTARAAKAPKSASIGGTKINLVGPAGHKWVNKKTEMALYLLPGRYSGVVRHIISIYYLPSQNSLTKLYNNYCCIFYVGPASKKWTPADVALLQSHLIPEGKEPDPDRAVAGGAYLRALLEDGVDYSVSKSKSERYYKDMQEGVVLDRTPVSAVAAKLHKRKKEKDKYIVLALALVKDKLVGMLYYQVTPGAAERERAESVMVRWQKALLAANQ